MSAARTRRLQAELRERQVDAAVVSSRPGIAYVTGLHVTAYERFTAVVVPADGPVRLVVPSLEQEAASHLDQPAQVHVWRDDEGHGGALAAALTGLDSAAVEHDALPLGRALEVQRMAGVPALGDCGPVLGALREVKDDDELAAVRRAAAVVGRALRRLLAEELRPGRTEAEIVTAYRAILVDEGGEGVPFEPAVLAGGRAATPHQQPDGTPIEQGQLVVVDVGAVVGGYCADVTRTVVCGRPTAFQAELFDAVRRAHDEGIDALRPGTSCGAVDERARAVLADAGHGPAFFHRLGHGLGLEVHETPYLRAGNPARLRAGSVVTVEPGAYYADRGGVRIEDDVLVTGAGPEVLTHLPISLDPEAYR
jgi:Xaa-Pro dipeptidase